MSRGRWAQQLGRVPGLLPLARGLRDRFDDLSVTAIRSRPHVAVNSMPKAGTHLLREACQALGVEFFQPHVTRMSNGRLKRLNGALFFTHLSYTADTESRLRSHGYRQLLLVRGPLDVAVSYICYVLARSDHPQHDLYRSLAERDLRECVRLRMCGGYGHKGFAALYEEYFAWSRRPGVTVLRYEDLNGAGGAAVLCECLKALQIPFEPPTDHQLSMQQLAPPQKSVTYLPRDERRDRVRGLIESEFAEHWLGLQQQYVQLTGELAA